jgi:hypothetical protein
MLSQHTPRAGPLPLGLWAGEVLEHGNGEGAQSAIAPPHDSAVMAEELVLLPASAGARDYNDASGRQLDAIAESVAAHCQPDNGSHGSACVANLASPHGWQEEGSHMGVHAEFRSAGPVAESLDYRYHCCHISTRCSASRPQCRHSQRSEKDPHFWMFSTSCMMQMRRSGGMRENHGLDCDCQQASSRAMWTLAASRPHIADREDSCHDRGVCGTLCVQRHVERCKQGMRSSLMQGVPAHRSRKTLRSQPGQTQSLYGSTGRAPGHRRCSEDQLGSLV